MLIKSLHVDFRFSDERGQLIQLVSRGYEQINYVFSKAGVIRGNHFHKYNDEAFYVIRGRLILSAERDGEHEKREFKTGDMFLVPAWVKHSFKYAEDTELIGLYTCCVELKDGTRDIYVE